ncbi:insulinase family protein [uncultured Agrobacterium sp.]|uniref:M16 family metallopeptidase n=1 Tax=uncultured Agrobacterium sp. TaxID=157277 RepID=UPI0025F3C0CA|nr:insulinase family protein [uncultured Agrobacterium sp.]
MKRAKRLVLGRALPLAMIGTLSTSGSLAQDVAHVANGSGATDAWAHRGSDIPADAAWRTGTLPNGLRYAVRTNAQPTRSISIRIRVDVGALMEDDDQQGWAYLLEHMVFRGSSRFPDGAAMQEWERLGASFGSDTNAATSLTSTTFKLDLPRSDAESYGHSLDILADMLATARLDPILPSCRKTGCDRRTGQSATAVGREDPVGGKTPFSVGNQGRAPQHCRRPLHLGERNFGTASGLL